MRGSSCIRKRIFPAAATCAQALRISVFFVANSSSASTPDFCSSVSFCSSAIFSSVMSPAASGGAKAAAQPVQQGYAVAVRPRISGRCSDGAGGQAAAASTGRELRGQQ